VFVHSYDDSPPMSDSLIRFEGVFGNGAERFAISLTFRSTS